MKFPLVIEQALTEIKAFQTQAGFEYERKLRQDEVLFSCRKGCHYCCHYPFLITVAEGILLHRDLASRGHWTPSLQKALEEHREKTLGLSIEVWLLTNIPCPLLEDGMCAAYSIRPLHCRATFSVGDPEMCHPHSLGNSTMLIPSSEVVVEYCETLLARLRRIEMLEALMPLSEAVLLGASLEMGSLEINDLRFQYTKDFYA